MTMTLETGREKVRQHRDRLRAQGLRPLQVWVPDVKGVAFRTAAHEQSAAVASGGFAEADQAFIDALSDPLDDGAAHG